MKSRSLFFGAALLLVVPLSNAWGQTEATLGGTVRDASGAFIPGVAVTSSNMQTGIVTRTLTNETGTYNFASLQPGTYRVSAELTGFQSTSQNEVALGQGQQVRLNITLQVSDISQTVEVTESAEALVTTSASVSQVLTQQRIRDLPLSTRSVLDLLDTTAGVRRQGEGRNEPGSFGGLRVATANVTRDGINVQNGRYQEAGAFSTTFVSPDLIEEFRVISAPVDAEMGRGSGQVQMMTRSGTNQFAGSVFWSNRNSALQASDWFNNFNGVSKNYENRNQFGARMSGPVIPNKTFFFFLIDAQRYVTKETVVGNALTLQARQGVFRYFPNAQNRNAVQANATVDLLGNPVRPSAATGDLQSFSVFDRDPSRPAMDASGFIRNVIARMPTPNDFTTGDGLNTAGFRWVRRSSGANESQGTGPNSNRDTWNWRIDHNFSQSHRFSFSGSYERQWSHSSAAGLPAWPSEWYGLQESTPYIYTASLISTLSRNVVNEFRFGIRNSKFDMRNSYERLDSIGEEALAFLPKSNGIPYIVQTTLFNNTFATFVSTGRRNSTSPLWMYKDALSITKGQHAFKSGGEIRFTSSNAANAIDIVPRAQTGAGAFQVQGINSTSIPGLASENQTLAQNLLTDLSGSVGSIIQTFVISGSANPQFLDYRDVPEKMKRIDVHQNEWMLFFKDDWKIHPNLTLNLGARYEFFGVPWEKKGLMGAPKGGSGNLFGISGTGYQALWTPGASQGRPFELELVGKNSPNPNRKIHKDDWNNIAPAVGLSWSIPWLGRTTILRTGYAINHDGAARFNPLDASVGSAPGMNSTLTLTPASYTNFTSVALPIPRTDPLKLIPLTERSQTAILFDDNWVIPYVQNYTFEIQRDLSNNLQFEVRYVGTKATRQTASIDLNDVNVFENGILEAFNMTRRGQDAPLFDRMLMGINLGSGPVNGTSLTGSAALRQNSTTSAFIANGEVGRLADYLNRNPVGTAEPGGLLRRNGFAENFIVVNPQLNRVQMWGNTGNNTYHGATVQLTKRMSKGFYNQTSYTWSRSLGEAVTDGVRGGNITFIDPRDRTGDKHLIQHRTHDFRSTGVVTMPFGPTQPLLAGTTGFVARLIENWQLGGIMNLTSGAPLTFLSNTATLTNNRNTFADIVGNVPKTLGKITKVQNGVVYFDGLKQTTDPAINDVTNLQATRGRYNRFAITDSSGNVILVNPAPGTRGNLGWDRIEGPGSFRLDMNILKRTRIDERRELELRFDAFNILNHANFAPPTMDINSPDFGRITTSGDARSWIINARLSF